MKRAYLKLLIKEVVDIIGEDDTADSDIERATKTVATKLRSGKDLTHQEADLAINSTEDKPTKEKLAQGLSKSSGLVAEYDEYPEDQPEPEEDDDSDEPDDFESCQSDEEMDSYFNRQIAKVNRADPTRYKCPDCGENVLSAYQHVKGYRCDSCADRAERGIDETENNGESVRKNIPLTIKKDFKSASGIEFKVGTTVNISFKEDATSYASVELPPGSEKKFMRFPIAHMSKYFSKCQPAPSVKVLERWNEDGKCKTVFGYWTEPDGHDQYGAPSWLLVLGVI